MTNYIHAVELSAEQEARAQDIFQEIVGCMNVIDFRGGEMGAARFIVHLQDALKVAIANQERLECERSTLSIIVGSESIASLFENVASYRNFILQMIHTFELSTDA